MVYQQEADPAFVGKLFQPGYYIIIVGVAVLVAARLPDFLQGVNDNEPGVLVFLDKAL